MYYGIIPRLTFLINVIMLPVITPYLTTDDYAVQGILSSYSYIFVAVAPLGLHVHLVNSFYEYPGKYRFVWGRILYLFLILGLGFGFLNVVVLVFSLPQMPLWNSLLLGFLGSVPIFFMSNSILAQHLFPVLERPKPLVFTNLVASLLGILVSFILIYF